MRARAHTHLPTLQALECVTIVQKGTWYTCTCTCRARIAGLDQGGQVRLVHGQSEGRCSVISIMLACFLRKGCVLSCLLGSSLGTGLT